MMKYRPDAKTKYDDDNDWLLRWCAELATELHNHADSVHHLDPDEVRERLLGLRDEAMHMGRHFADRRADAEERRNIPASDMHNTVAGQRLIKAAKRYTSAEIEASPVVKALSNYASSETAVAAGDMMRMTADFLRGELPGLEHHTAKVELEQHADFLDALADRLDVVAENVASDMATAAITPETVAKALPAPAPAP